MVLSVVNLISKLHCKKRFAVFPSSEGKISKRFAGFPSPEGKISKRFAGFPSPEGKISNLFYSVMWFFARKMTRLC